MKPTIASLFSGCGGLDLGFKRAGFKIIWANDISKEACVTYRKNVSNEVICDDIINYDLDSIPKADIVIGGPPCQPFSLAGKRTITDIRRNPLFKFIEAVNVISPKIFVMENVIGLKSAVDIDCQSILDKTIKSFHKLNYVVISGVLNAADYGVPQLRKRLFLIGFKDIKKSLKFPDKTHDKIPNREHNGYVSVYDALSDLPKPNLDNEECAYLSKPMSNYQEMLRAGNGHTVHNHWYPHMSELDRKIISYVPPGGNYKDIPSFIPSKRIAKYKKTGGRTTTYGRLNKDRPAYTINTYFSRLNVGCNIHYEQDRLITIREGLRLQSFPDEFIIPHELPKKWQYTLVGNAVPPLLSLSLAKSIKAELES